MTLHWPTAADSVSSARAAEIPSVTVRVEVDRLLADGHCVALVLEAPVGVPEVLVSHEIGLPPDWQPSVFWHSDSPVGAHRDPATPVPPNTKQPTDPADETVVGLGVFAEVTAPWGETSALRRFGDERLKRFRVVGAGTSLVTPRLFAAIGFSPPLRQTPGVDAWADFGGAWGVIPRLAYVARRARKGGAKDQREAWFCLTLGPADLPHVDAMLGQIAWLGRKLRSSTIEPGQLADAIHAPEETSEATWASWIEQALGAIGDQKLEKVVAARTARFTFHGALSPAHTLLSLGMRHLDSTRFAFFRGQSTFLGATPERLIAKRGNDISTEALAGTVRRGESAFDENSTLDFGPKEHKEHSPVLAQILATLAPYCSSLSHDPSPRLRAQQQVLHLRTAVRGSLKEPYHALSLVQALHPTPAVGGCPTAPALTWIAQHEDFDRGLYAGPVGWVDAAGDGQFNVALRSGVLRAEQATLFAGAGIVAGSDPRREFEETALKLQVLLGSLCYGPAATSR